MAVFPLILIFLASICAAGVAFGTNSDWVLRPHGLKIIMAAHHLEWPLTVAAMLLCLLLIALVASGKRRIFWLIGLAPVAVLLFYHFRSGQMRGFAVLDDPPFVAASDAGGVMGDDDYVVGVRVGDAAYAYPYVLLYTNPVVLHSDRARRVLVMWSPFANRAIAELVDHDVRAEELDIVSMPANALLLYNSRLGQFINCVTGMTPAGEVPKGFVSTLPVVKTTWKQWRTMHPETRVLSVAAGYATGLPHRAVEPYFKTPAATDLPLNQRVTLIGTGASMMAVPSEEITALPANLTPDAGTPMVIFRDPASNVVRAFDRRFQPDISPEFHIVSDPHRPNVALVDAATNTGWSLAGVAVDGEQKFRGLKLAAVPVDENLPYAVIKFWYPGIMVEHIKPENQAVDVAPPGPSSKPVAHRSVRRHHVARGR